MLTVQRPTITSIVVGVPEVEGALGVVFVIAPPLISSSRFSQGCCLALATCISFSEVSSIYWKCGRRLLDLEWTFLGIELPIPPRECTLSRFD